VVPAYQTLPPLPERAPNWFTPVTVFLAFGDPMLNEPAPLGLDPMSVAPLAKATFCYFDRP